MKTLFTLATLAAALFTTNSLQARPGYNDYTPVAQAPTRIAHQANSKLVPNCDTMTVFTGVKQGYVPVSCHQPAVSRTAACAERCAQNS